MLSKRFSEEVAVALLTTSSSPEIDISHYSSGEVFVPNGTPIGTITWFTASPAGTYFAAYDATPAAITQTVVQNRSYPIPPALFGAAKIQARVDVAGSVRISLKS